MAQDNERGSREVKGSRAASGERAARGERAAKGEGSGSPAIERGRARRAGTRNAATARTGADRTGGGRREGRESRGMPFAMVITDPHLPDNPIAYVNKAFENVEFKMLTGERARLIVDDGIGLTGDVDWPYAGEDGARASEERTERRTGTRVGARLARQMVEALDAEIDVTSGSFGTSVQVGIDLDRLAA